MSRQVNIGIAGCGFACTRAVYAPILRLLENCQVSALMDPDQHAIDFMVQNYGDFDCYTDYDEFLERSNIDAVLIASPVFFHEEQVIKAAQAGKHILCEKPMAPTIEACDSMLQSVAEHNVKLMIGFVRRFDKSLELAHDLLQGDKLGRLFHIRAEVSWCHDNSPLGDNWRQSVNTLGGVFQDNASHIIDLCRWWAGDVQTVSGEIRMIRPDWEVETHAHATLRHTNDTISTIHVSNVSQKPMTEYFLLEGTDASLEIAYGPGLKYCSPEPYRVHLWEQGLRRTDLTPYNEINLDIELRQRGMFKRQLDHFCHCVLNDQAPWTDGLAGRKATEIINATYLSSWRKEKIELPLVGSDNLEQIFLDIRNQEI